MENSNLPTNPPVAPTPVPPAANPDPQNKNIKWGIIAAGGLFLIGIFSYFMVGGGTFKGQIKLTSNDQTKMTQENIEELGKCIDFNKSENFNQEDNKNTAMQMKLIKDGCGKDGLRVFIDGTVGKVLHSSITVSANSEGFNYVFVYKPSASAGDVILDFGDKTEVKTLPLTGGDDYSVEDNGELVIKHTYKTATDYTVTAKQAIPSTTDPTNLAKPLYLTATKEIKVVGPAEFKAEFVISSEEKTPLDGVKVTFADKSTSTPKDKIQYWTFDFGDGSTTAKYTAADKDKLGSVIHMYEYPVSGKQEYSPILKISNEDGTITNEYKLPTAIVVEPPAQAAPAAVMIIGNSNNVITTQEPTLNFDCNTAPASSVSCELIMKPFDTGYSYTATWKVTDSNNQALTGLSGTGDKFTFSAPATGDYTIQADAILTKNADSTTKASTITHKYTISDIGIPTLLSFKNQPNRSLFADVLSVTANSEAYLLRHAGLADPVMAKTANAFLFADSFGVYKPNDKGPTFETINYGDGFMIIIDNSKEIKKDALSFIANDKQWYFDLPRADGSLISNATTAADKLAIDECVKKLTKDGETPEQTARNLKGCTVKVADLKAAAAADKAIIDECVKQAGKTSESCTAQLKADKEAKAAENTAIEKCVTDGTKPETISTREQLEALTKSCTEKNTKPKEKEKEKPIPAAVVTPPVNNGGGGGGGGGPVHVNQ